MKDKRTYSCEDEIYLNFYDKLKNENKLDDLVKGTLSTSIEDLENELKIRIAKLYCRLEDCNYRIEYCISLLDSIEKEKRSGENGIMVKDRWVEGGA